MLDSENEKEIRGLIRSGFDKKLISFELGIPIEEIEQLVKNMQREAQDASTTRNTGLNLLRQRYYRLYSAKNSTENKKTVELSPEEMSLINKTIEEIESIVQRIKTSVSSSEKHHEVSRVRS